MSIISEKKNNAASSLVEQFSEQLDDKEEVSLIAFLSEQNAAKEMMDFLTVILMLQKLDDKMSINCNNMSSVSLVMPLHHKPSRRIWILLSEDDHQF
ncbi:hypothetical protein LOAG_10628 [Loa loa]|uniref:Uncharacterized protein n=1 Tax=Loa loa TaxID=7209 RepID=A0A1S0TQ33_LOALO|nr:hypothetical protein LOAG_10628 [Loa loa]EFO17868.2 hypothetical protein LOAG_10628 [Loa loa]